MYNSVLTAAHKKTKKEQRNKEKTEQNSRKKSIYNRGNQSINQSNQSTNERQEDKKIINNFQSVFSQRILHMY